MQDNPLSVERKAASLRTVISLDQSAVTGVWWLPGRGALITALSTRQQRVTIQIAVATRTRVTGGGYEAQIDVPALAQPWPIATLLCYQLRVCQCKIPHVIAT